MRKIVNVWVGDQEDCFPRDRFAVVHACKHPCYLENAGADRMILTYETLDNLYLNMVDSVSSEFSIYCFMAAIEFIYRKKNQGKDVLIHCNKGESRSGAIALLWLAETEIIPNDSYLDAHKVYVQLDENYFPGTGIVDFMQKNWENLLNAK